jgi:hypothetical protein
MPAFATNRSNLDEFAEVWFQYILDHPEKPWSWSSLSNNPNVTSELASKHTNLPWHWDKVECKFQTMDLGRVLDISAFSWEAVKDEDDDAVDWYWVSSHPSLTWQTVRDNLHRPWDWSQISRAPFMRWSIVEQNPDIPWNWGSLSANPMAGWRAEWEETDEFLQKELDTVLASEAANQVD